jgi:1-acyl-sn-glycerol-3-phosphate acyltransferase
VERRQDNVDTSSNRSSFEACHRVLAAGHAVAIFPEGTTHDRLQLAPIRTGAARIALGARASGVEGITMVPVGILYESKFKLRSRALVRIGEPIDLDDAVATVVPGRTAGGEEDHEAVPAPGLCLSPCPEVSNPDARVAASQQLERPGVVISWFRDSSDDRSPA